jgi:hypothetical protein
MPLIDFISAKEAFAKFGSIGEILVAVEGVRVKSPLF